MGVSVGFVWSQRRHLAGIMAAVAEAAAAGSSGGICEGHTRRWRWKNGFRLLRYSGRLR